jgi:hypothetical protein
MAITATLTSTTLYSLKYRVQYDGDGTATLGIPRTTLIADSEPGGAPPPIPSLSGDPSLGVPPFPPFPPFPGVSPSASPLKMTLETPMLPAGWDALTSGPLLSLHTTVTTIGAGSMGAEFLSIGGDFHVPFVGLSVSFTSGVPMEGIVEIRYNHTFNR